MPPSPNPVRVLTVGAGGPTASLVIPPLLARGASVRALAHTPKDEEAARRLGVTDIVVGELSDPSTIRRALADRDAAFYIAPIALADEAEVGTAFIAAARAAGLRRVVFSSVIHPVIRALDNHAGKIPVEEALLTSGMEYVLLHPALFYQNFASAWPRIRQTGIHAEPWSNETRFSRVDYRDVAEVAALALTEDRLLNGTFELCAEGWLDRHEIAAAMTTVLGRKVTAKSIPPPTGGKSDEKLASMFDWYDKHALLGSSLTLRAILGREPRTLEAYLQELNAESGAESGK